MIKFEISWFIEQTSQFSDNKLAFYEVIKMFLFSVVLLNS